MTDHDAIAARVRQDRETGTPGLWRVGPVDDTIVTAADGSEVAAVDGDYNEPDLWPIMEANARRIATLPDLEAAYLDLHDEVKRLRGELAQANNEFGSETAEWPALWRRIAELKDISNDRWQRAEKAEAERADEWTRRREAEASRDLEKAVCATIKAERDALWAALEEIADGLKGIARDIQIGPDDEGREIYEMAKALQWDACQALKGQTND